MRLRAGELAALAVSVALVAVLFSDWVDPRESGWDALGTVSAVLVVLSILLVAGMIATIVSGQTVAAQVVSAIAAVWATGLTFIVLTIDVIGIAADDDLELRGPAYAGVLAQLLLFITAWRSMSDERTSARGAAYEPPPARSLPES